MDYISVIGSQVKFRVKDSSQKSKLYLNGDQSVPQAHPQRPKGSKLGQDDKNPAKKSVAGRTLLVAFLQGPTKYLWVSQDALLKQTFVNRSNCRHYCKGSSFLHQNLTNIISLSV